jgi:hypothetical protein
MGVFLAKGYTGESWLWFRHGCGRQPMPDGVYEGQWWYNTPTGAGTYTWNNGDKYQGEFLHGQRQGRGVLRSHRGWVYEGEWRNDKPHGKCTLTYGDGTVFSGSFVNNARQGEGQTTLKNGDAYMCTYKEDKVHGSVVYVFANGDKATGSFQHGRPVGNFTVVLVNRNVTFEARWPIVNGQPTVVKCVHSAHMHAIESTG